jgi:hypothetical protein
MTKTTRTGALPRGGAWLSLVERLLWEQDVGGSNPLAPTTARTIQEGFTRSVKHVDGAGANLQTSKDSDAIRRADATVGARL